MRLVFALSAAILVMLTFVFGLLGFNRLFELVMVLSVLAIVCAFEPLTGEATNPSGVVQKRRMVGPRRRAGS
jgi:hypothetical protein